MSAWIAALDDHVIQKEVIEALGILGDVTAIPKLRQIFDTEDDKSICYVAALALLQLRDDVSIPEIVDLVKSFGTSWFEMTYKILAAMDNLGESAVSGLIDLLIFSENNYFHDVIAKYLKRIGTQEALSAVKKWEFTL